MTQFNPVHKVGLRPHSFHCMYPEKVFLTQFNLYVHSVGLKHHSFIPIPRLDHQTWGMYSTSCTSSFFISILITLADQGLYDNVQHMSHVTEQKTLCSQYDITRY